MKEKYLFFTLLIIAVVLGVGSLIGKGAKSEASARERKLQQALARAEKKGLPQAEKIVLEKVQNLVAFSEYEGLLKRSPFFKVEPQSTQAAGKTAPVVSIPVEEKTPLFLYKGRIFAGKRLLVLIEQTRRGEVFMVAKGENIDGYKVLDITDTEVILSKKDAGNIILKTVEGP